MKNFSLVIKITILLYCILAGIVSNARNVRAIDVEKLKNAYPTNSTYSKLNMFAELNGVFYFNADDGIHGGELWRSDGTAAGTWLVKDINPGVVSSNANDIIASGNKIYFSASDGVNGPELWTSDGTAAGTHMVANISSSDVEENNPSFITDVEGTVYFVTSSYFYSRDMLWKTDGTNAGTKLVANLASAPFYGNSISQLTNVNGKLFFTANNYSNYFDVQLYVSDGTTAGTTSVEDINPNGYDSPAGLTALNGLLYFTVQDKINSHLWVSDGTAQGTHAVNNANNIFTPLSDPYTINPITIKGKTLFFQGYNASGDYELYKYNTSGANNNIELVKNIVPGKASSYPGNITNVNGILFFTIAPDNADAQLWKTDGTEDGTALVKDINPGGINNFYGLVGMGSTLMFAFSNKDLGFELWKSDGTEAGTVIVKDIFPGNYSSSPGYFTYKAGMFVFSANDGAKGFEFWKSDGTATGTVLVKNINHSSSSSSFPYGFTGLGKNKTLFVASTGKYGYELWVTNGHDIGTRLVKDIYAGSSGSFTSNPGDLIERFQNNVYFFANDSSGYYLGKTDGTPAGTTLFYKLNINDYVQEIVATDNLLYFVIINSNTSRNEIWRTDGTAKGTYVIWKTLINYFSFETVGVGNTLFFNNYNDKYGLELWKTDGTTAGTALVKDIAPGSSWSFPSNLYGFNGQLYFTADYGYGSFLWTSDGTNAGTKMVKAVIVDSYTPFAQANNKLFFNGFNTTAKGYELYATDGTSAGTQLIKDINKGLAWSSPSYLVDGDTLLYFLANDKVHGVELWVSDGMEKGTKLVKNITPGSRNSSLEYMVNVNDRLFFTMKDTLWQSDGTKAGTHKIQDKTLDGTKTLNEFRAVGDRLYFSAYNYSIGNEVYTAKVVDMFEPGIAAAQEMIANIPATNTFNVKLLNNPIDGQLRFSVNIKDQQAVQIIITDVLGKVLTNARQTLPSGTTILSYNTKGWTSGMYMVKVLTSNGATFLLKALK